MSSSINREQVFQLYSQAFVSLAQGKDPVWSLDIPEAMTIGQKTSDKQFLTRVEYVVRGVFDKNKAMAVTTTEVIEFVTNFASFLKGTQKFSVAQVPKIWNRVMNTLYSENLQFLPWNMLEVFLSRKTEEQITSVELRALENGLVRLVEEFSNFKNLLYSCYFDYLGALIGSKIESLGGKIRREDIEIDWEKIPLRSPEAVNLASILQRAKENSKAYLTLPELYKNFAVLNAESKKVLQICMLDFLWDCIADTGRLFYEKVICNSISRSENKGKGCHPAVKRALKASEVFFESLDELGNPKGKTKSELEDYKAKQRWLLTRKCLLELLKQASLYKESFDKMRSLYAKGLDLYTRELTLNYGFIPSTFAFPTVELFNEETIFIINIKDIDSLYSEEDVNQIVPITLMDRDDQEDFLLGLIFQKKEEQDAVIEELFFDCFDCEYEKEEEGDFPRVVESYLPKHLIKEKKQRQRKKTSRAVKSLSGAMKELAISTSPQETHLIKKDLKCVEKENVANDSFEKKESVPLKTTSSSPPVEKKQKEVKIPLGEKKCSVKVLPAPVVLRAVRSVWKTPSCLEGSEKEINEALNISFPVHWHVLKRFVQLREVEDERGAPTKSLRNHTYPLFIAGIIQRNAAKRFRPSIRREYDSAYGCSGSIKEGNEISLGVFTESFFAKDTIDGKKDTLFHHWFKEQPSAETIQHYRETGAFYVDGDIEDVKSEIKEIKKTVFKASSSKRTFRLTFVRNSCTVDDSAMHKVFTMVFLQECKIFS